MTRQQKISHMQRKGWRVKFDSRTGDVIVVTRGTTYIFGSINKAHKFLLGY